MKVSIVTEPAPGWILRQLAYGFGSSIKNCIISNEPSKDADVNFYMNYALYNGKTNIDIGYFTHKELGPPFNKVFEDVAREVDWCVAMCDITAKLLPPEKTSIIKPAPHEQFYKDEIVFGVVGREYPSGRKNFHLIEEIRKIPRAKVLLTNGALSFEELPNFYRSIDYLVVLSSNEGGPMPVLEALAQGTPIIAPNVGFCWDYPVIRYGNQSDLLRLIASLVLPRDLWGDLSQQLYALCLKLLEKKDV